MDSVHLTVEMADGLAELPLHGIGREYPNKLDHVISGAEDLLSPSELHPAFYGCYDWHSAVHGHWTLIRLLKLSRLSKENEIRKALATNLTIENIATEVSYLHQPNRESFERPYGWAWLLYLAAELKGWEDEDGIRWASALRPLEEAIVARFLAFLPKQTYAIRHGVHSNTAFSLILALQYAITSGQDELRGLIEDRARTYFLEDAQISAEPSGADFVSPALTIAALLQRVLPQKEFSGWFDRIFDEHAWRAILAPATVSDRDDPQIGHLDGLNLSRAWCMRRVAEGLPSVSPVAHILRSSASIHLEAALPQLKHGNYNGQHWLATFAVLALTDAIDESCTKRLLPTEPGPRL